MSRSNTGRPPVPRARPGVQRTRKTVLLRVELSAAELTLTEVDDRLGVVRLEGEETGVHPGVGVPENLTYGGEGGRRKGKEGEAGGLRKKRGRKVKKGSQFVLFERSREEGSAPA